MDSNKAKRRKSWSNKEARKHIDALASSGESMAAYARANGIDAGRLWWWKRKLQPKAKQTIAETFVPIGVNHRQVESPPQTDDCIEVRLLRGQRIAVRPGFDATTLQQVVQIMEQIPC